MPNVTMYLAFRLLITGCVSGLALGSSCYSCPQTRNLQDCTSKVQCSGQCFFAIHCGTSNYELGCTTTGHHSKVCENGRHDCHGHGHPYNCHYCCNGDSCNNKNCDDTVVVREPITTKQTTTAPITTESTTVTIMTQKASTAESTTTTAAAMTTMTQTASTTTMPITANTDMPTTSTAAQSSPTAAQSSPTAVQSSPTTMQSTTVSPSVRSCIQCGDESTGTACTTAEESLGGTSCPVGKDFCMVDAIELASGKTTLYHRCVDETTCRQDYLVQTSSVDKCHTVPIGIPTGGRTCRFCCTADDCNIKAPPEPATLYNGTLSPPTSVATSSAPSTDMETTSTAAQSSPTAAQSSPTAAQSSPTAAQSSPTAAQSSPTAVHTSTTTVQSTTIPISVRSCIQCGDESTGTACTTAEESLGGTSCPVGKDFCMVDAIELASGKTTLYHRCVNETICHQDYLVQTSSVDKCHSIPIGIPTGGRTCRFCCTADDCNIKAPPEPATLYNGRTCLQCGDESTGSSCTPDEEIAGGKPCPAGHNYCMVDVFEHANFSTSLYRRCVDETTCNRDWWIQSSDEEKCQKYNGIPIVGGRTCHFCCTTDDCNVVAPPDKSSLYRGSAVPLVG